MGTHLISWREHQHKEEVDQFFERDCYIKVDLLSAKKSEPKTLDARNRKT